MGEIEQNLDRHRPQIDSNINTVRPKNTYRKKQKFIKTKILRQICTYLITEQVISLSSHTLIKKQK